jgi:Uma2 family endonuclease
MSTQTLPCATLDDLMKFDGNAELINGRIVPIMPNGFWPGQVAKEILLALNPYVVASGVGVVSGDGVGYAITPALPSGRQSFSPDVSYYVGPHPGKRMKFINGAPTFAVEVRSENDYGPAKEKEHADKRKDYFDAGTLVVWDVDPVNETVTVYTSADPSNSTVFRRGDTANAEPAVPGWRLAVDGLFA